MDPLSITVAVVALIGAARKVIETSSSLISRAQHAPQMVQDSLREVRLVEGCLNMLKTYFDNLGAIDPQRAALVRLDNLSFVMTNTTLTFCDLNKLLNHLAKLNPSALRSAVVWSSYDRLIQNLLIKLQGHKTDLSLILNIIQGENQIEAHREMQRLAGLMRQFMLINQGFSQRFAEADVSPDLISILDRSQVGEDSVAGSGREETASDVNTVVPPRRRPFSISDWQARRTNAGFDVLGFAFEEELQESGVYRRARNNECDGSFAPSGLRSYAWSLSRLSLSNVSSLSVVALPITKADIDKILNSDLSASAQEIYAGVTPGGLRLANPVGGQESGISKTEPAAPDPVKKQKAERKTIFSRRSLDRVSEKIAAIDWALPLPRRTSRSVSNDGTGSLYYDGEFHDSAKGIDHIDYQESVRSISTDYSDFRKLSSLTATSGAEPDQGANRWCSRCRQRSDFFFWSTDNYAWLCEYCYTRKRS